MPVVPPSSGSGSGNVVWQEEGSAVGTAAIVNFVGSPTTVTHSGGTATVTTTATSGVVTQEVDGTPSGTATVIVFPNTTLTFSNGTATYTPTGGGSTDGAGTLVQSYAWATIASAGTANLGATPTNGNILLLFSVANQFTISSITQTNVTWSKVARANYGGNITNPEVWIGTVAASAGTGVVVTYSGNNVQAIIIQEYSGLASVDAAQSCMIQNSTVAALWDTHHIAWDNDGGRVFLLMQNPTGGSPTAPAGSSWVASTGSPFNYGGTGYGALYTIDANASSLRAAYARFTVPNTDNFLAVLLHAKP